MKTLLLLFICSAWILPLKGQTFKEESKINIGLKAGFNSSMYFTDCLQMNGQRFDDVQNNYKVGYFAALFFRFHMKRHFIQPEFMYNVYKGEVAFDKNQNAEALPPAFARLNSTIHSLEIPMLYGYSFVKQAPYGMAFFVGPKLNYVWKQKTRTEFTDFGYPDMVETFYPLSMSAVIGLGVNISNIFFDFRYEIGLNNISKSITSDNIIDGELHQEESVTVNRHRNVLSFSLGVIF